MALDPSAIIVTEQPHALTSLQKGVGFDGLASADRLLFRFPKTRKSCCDDNNAVVPLFEMTAITSQRQIRQLPVAITTGHHFIKNQLHQKQQLRDQARADLSHFQVMQEFRFPDCLCDVEMYASLCCCAEDCFAFILSCCIPPARKPFLYEIFDENSQSILRADKPYRCLWPYQGPIGCYGCSCTRTCQDEVLIESPAGNFIGRVVQHNCCQEFPYLSVHGFDGHQRLVVGQPSNCCTDPQEVQRRHHSCGNRCDACCQLCLCLCGAYRLSLATCLTGCCISAEEVVELQLYEVFRTNEYGQVLIDESTLKSNSAAVASIAKIIKPRPGCARPLIEFEIRLSPDLDVDMRAGVIASFLLLFNTTQPVARISRE